MKPNQETIVVSLGGSLIVPSSIDIRFLQKLKQVLEKFIKGGKKFVIVSGGGQTARAYQQAASQISSITKEDVDWLGIHATRLNAHLLRAIFYKQANPKVVKNPNRLPNFKEKMLIGAGWKPGWSTDYVAVEIAKKIGAARLVNLSNVNYIYTKDPKKFTDARPIKEISWENFRKIIPPKWSPGLNCPFDPIASREAERIGLEVAIINGKKLSSFSNYLEGKRFTGTLIS